MILNFEGQHSGDVIMALPVITSLRRSGVDVKIYVADDYKHLLTGFGLEYVSKPIGPKLSTQNITGHATEFWLDYFRVEPVKMDVSTLPATSTVVLSPDARTDVRRFPNEFWEAIVWWCSDRNLPVTVIGPKDAVKRNAFLSGSNITNLTGEQTIEETYATLKHALAVVTTDTGTSHLSDALNDVTITAFRVNNDEKFAPYWNRRVVKDLSSTIKHLETLINK